jgi:hypothetical protein
MSIAVVLIFSWVNLTCLENEDGQNVPMVFQSHLYRIDKSSIVVQPEISSKNKNTGSHIISHPLDFYMLTNENGTLPGHI